MASQRRPALSIFPNQIHIGDRFIEADIADEEREWEVASRPVTFKKGQEVRARVQRPDNPAISREKSWPAFEKITVRRITAAASPAKAEPEPGDDNVEARARSSGGCAVRTCGRRSRGGCRRRRMLPDARSATTRAAT